MSPRTTSLRRGTIRGNRKKVGSALYFMFAITPRNIMHNSTSNVATSHRPCSLCAWFLWQLLSLNLTDFIKVIHKCHRCTSTVSTCSFNYKAVSCMVAELWQFENFRPKLDLDLLYQGQRSFKNNVIDAHLQCLLMTTYGSITGLYLVWLASYSYLKISYLIWPWPTLSRSKVIQI